MMAKKKYIPHRDDDGTYKVYEHGENEEGDYWVRPLTSKEVSNLPDNVKKSIQKRVELEEKARELMKLREQVEQAEEDTSVVQEPIITEPPKTVVNAPIKQAAKDVVPDSRKLKEFQERVAKLEAQAKLKEMDTRTKKIEDALGITGEKTRARYRKMIQEITEKDGSDESTT